MLRCVTANATADLQAPFADLALANFEPDLLVLIGHSDRGVLEVGPAQPPLGWEGVASWFQRLAPRRLLVLGCEAAQWLPCGAMFGRIPELGEIYGSPVGLGKRVAQLLPAAVPFLLGARVDPDVVAVIRLGALAHGEILIRRTRAESRRTSREEGESVQEFESLLAAFVRALRR